MVIVVIIIYVLCWGFEFMIYFFGFFGVFMLKVIYYGVVFVFVLFNFCVNFIVYSF